MMTVTKELSNKFANTAILCSFFVVVIHCRPVFADGSVGWWLKQILENGICLSAVPYFFFASGFFLAGHVREAGWWQREIRKRVMSLLVPFVIWSVLYIVAIWLWGKAGDMLTLKGIARAFGLNPFWFPCLSPLWYVRALFVLVLMSPLLVFLSRRRNALVLMFVVYGALCPGPIGEGLMFGLFRFGLSLAGLFYLTLGMAVRDGVVALPSGRLRCGCCFAIGFLLVVVQAFAFRTNVCFAQYFGWLSIPCLIYGIWGLMPSASLPGFLAGCSFPVYMIHKFLYLPISWNHSWCGYLFACLGVFCGSIAITIVIRYLFPRFARIAFGGR